MHSSPRLLGLLAGLLHFFVAELMAIPPVNDRPNRYVEEEIRLVFPDGRVAGAISSIAPDSDGQHLWIVERCGGNSCADSPLHPVLKLDLSGRVVRQFGGGLMNAPHGLSLDSEGNIWVTDSQAGAQAPPANGKGHAVFKFSPAGTVLLVLGTPGVAGDGTGGLLNTPCHAVVAPDGTIFVADGHNAQNVPDAVARIVRFSADGRFLQAWGRAGSDRGEFFTPHAMAFDPAGNLVVADRGNNRLQIFRPDGTWVGESRLFGRPSALAFDSAGRIYVADSESSGLRVRNPGWRPGIRTGWLQAEIVESFIEWSTDRMPQGARPEAVAVGSDGVVYGGVVAQGGSLHRFRPVTPGKSP
ncbi:MAG: hypothetical protein FJ397_11740 [Verrucomicrobia bacterium]|nr:hypothetical protein [Verrucomicrobiota bacterium]